MPVKLFTGLPGAGKTASLVAELLRLQRLEPNRPVFAMGINGLKEGIAADLSMEQLQRWWEELPPGSIIAIDECQEDHLMPKDRGNPAAWVQKITKVRHFGMDFLLTTQHPQNMSAYVRRLVDQHVHSVRKFNTKIVERYTWGRCMDEPEKGSAQKAGTQTIGALPSEVFDLYKSASLHTMKKRIPPKVWFFAACVVAAVGSIIAAMVYIPRMNKKPETVAGAGTPAGSQAKVVEKEDLRKTDYVKWMTPRVAGVPWSAPAFDGQSVKAQPKLYCIADDTGKCICNTEQGTRYTVDVNVCRRMVADGGVYNPFVDGEDRDRRSGEEAKPPPGKAQPPPGASQPIAAGGGSAPFNRQVGADYTPPELTTVSALSSHAKR
jgi:hypothetical protein